MKKAETVFREKIIEPFLNSLQNAAHFSIQQKAIRGDADKMVCLHGFFVWLEIKTDEGVPDKLQAYKAAKVRQAGGIALLARPCIWGDLARFLKLLDGGIYDRSFLQSIDQNPVPASRTKAQSGADENARSVSRKAHRPRATKTPR